MVNIEIDGEVYSFLTNKAIPFVDKTPNDVLRRLLRVSTSKIHLEKEITNNNFRTRRKNPKTNLAELINSGLLKNGEVLYLHDYQGKKINNVFATLHNSYLIYNNKSYSMSDLARNLLREYGFQSNSVRGPIFWYNENGKSIKELWDIFLENHYKN